MKITVRNNGQEDIYGMTPEYPYVMHEVDTEEFFIPWHWHEELEFDYIVEGSIDVVTNNGTYSFKEGEGFFCNANVLCKMEGRPGGRRVVLFSHLFHKIFLSGHFKSIFEIKYLDPIIYNKNIEIIALRRDTVCQKKILSKLKQLYRIRKQQTDAEFETRNLLSEVWLLLMEEIETNDTARTNVDIRNQERILTMIGYIQRTYAEKFSLEDIAASANVSTRECLRCFKKNIKKTPFEYLMEYRLEKASELLRTTDMPVVEIAFETGFSSNAYFGKKFKEFRGMTPGTYRKSHMI